MHKKIYLFIVILLNIFILCFSKPSFSEAAWKAEKVTLRADPYCPFNCDPNAKDPGLMIEVAQKAYGKENVDYKILPWKRAIVEVRKAKYDAIVGSTPNDAPDFFVSSPIGKLLLCFYVEKSDPWKYINYKSISGRKLGIINGYAYPDFMTAYIDESFNNNNKFNLFQISGESRLLEKLFEQMNRNLIDTILEDESVINNLLSSNNLIQSKVKNAGCVTTQQDTFTIGISFSPINQVRSLRLVNRLNDTIKSMIESGEMLALAKKYNITKWW